MTHLRKPTLADEKQILAFRQAFGESVETIPGTSYLIQAQSVASWLAELEKFSDPKRIPAGFVRGLQFLYFSEDNQLVGMINLRTNLNDYLENYGGHIGYGIQPKFRRQGYGSQMLKETLVIAKEQGLKQVLLTCDDDNQGSAKVIEANGGKLADERLNKESQKVIRRYWINLE